MAADTKKDMSPWGNENKFTVSYLMRRFNYYLIYFFEILFSMVIRWLIYRIFWKLHESPKDDILHSQENWTGPYYIIRANVSKNNNRKRTFCVNQRFFGRKYIVRVRSHFKAGVNEKKHRRLEKQIPRSRKRQQAVTVNGLAMETDVKSQLFCVLPHVVRC